MLEDKRTRRRGEETHRIVNDVLGPRIVVNVYGDAAQGRDLGGQLVEARVVLALALVCL